MKIKKIFKGVLVVIAFCAAGVALLVGADYLKKRKDFSTETMQTFGVTLAYRSELESEQIDGLRDYTSVNSRILSRKEIEQMIDSISTGEFPHWNKILHDPSKFNFTHFRSANGRKKSIQETKTEALCSEQISWCTGSVELSRSLTNAFSDPQAYKACAIMPGDLLVYVLDQKNGLYISCSTSFPTRSSSD